MQNDLQCINFLLFSTVSWQLVIPTRAWLHVTEWGNLKYMKLSMKHVNPCG